MKLMVITPYYSPMAAAAAVRMHEMVKYLSNSEKVDKIEVIHWSHRNQSIIKSQKKEGKISVYRIKNLFPELFFRYQDPNPIYALYWFFITLFFIRKMNPDIVIITTPPGTILTAALSCKILNKKYIIDYRDQWEIVNSKRISSLKFPLKMFASLFHKWFIKISSISNKNALFISTVYDEVKENLKEKYGVQNVIVVKNGINKSEIMKATDNFNKETVINNIKIPYSNQTKIVTYVGDLSLPYYKPELILNSIRQLLEKGYDIYLIILSGRVNERFNYLVKETNLENRVKTLKRSHIELLGILMASDIGFYALRKNDPQARYAMGAKIYEYISCGLPILAVIDKNTNIYNLISEHKNGLVLTWNEKNELTNCLEELLIDDNKYTSNAWNLVNSFIDKYDRNLQYKILMKELEKYNS